MTVWGTWIALRQFKRGPLKPLSSDPPPPLSVLKPLKGADSGLESNLEGFFHLEYSEYEILFSVASPDDPARAVLERLLRRYPLVPARLLIGETKLGPNPKVNNMGEAYLQARHDWLLISDSNVRVPPSYLRDVVSCLEPGVGAVTAVVAGTCGEGIGGRLETTFLNSFYARWMLIARGFGHPFIVGKSMLFRRSTMERFGGIRTLGRYIAEDYMAGQAIRRLGLGIRIMGRPIVQYVGTYSIAEFWSRHVRWGRIRKAQSPIAFFFEPLMGAVVSGVLLASAFGSLSFFLVHLTLWSLFDLVLMYRMEGKLRPDCVPFWLLREILAVPLWIHIALGNSIRWRGNRLRILPGGLVVPKEAA